MTKAELPFRRDIIAAPEDDAPRLVFADQLDEWGQAERAEFIRVQCELARHSGCRVYGSVDDSPRCGSCPLCEGWDQLRRRERKLFDDHAAAWWADLPVCVALTPSDSCDKPGHGYPSRGFIVSVAAPIATLTGGECERCSRRGHGIGELRGRSSVINCSTCNGTGTTHGILPELMRWEPVEAVRASDKEPVNRMETIGNVELYDWWPRRTNQQRAVPESAIIDEPLWSVLVGNADALCTGYDSPDAANAALSRAMIEWAKTINKGKENATV